MMSDIDINRRRSHDLPTDKIFILGLTLIGWVVIGLSLFDMLLRGVAGSAGPGMKLFAGISPAALADKFDLPYKFSLCVTDTGIWAAADFAKSFLMWGAMILAMMLPTLLPLSQSKPKSLNFTIGYLSIWVIGCAFAVMLQWTLDINGFLDVNMISESSSLSATILIAVGVFQLSPFKQNQLAACQHTDAHLSGWQAGLNCMKCCGPLMLVMFVFGLMNVVVMALMTAFILAERYSKTSKMGLKIASAVLIVAGTASFF